ncbi:MAG: spore cortex biosynthesis protein YabQ [Marinisporobacter sp.]|jgi:spore cortex biosynthesis protein YabQ|nr:spore cortex biosynthesis protein YabQ [Marinisporobacter sp.]
MITYVSKQAYVFLATLYGGILIGFIYDLYRILRCIFKPKKIATIIEDLIFWIVIGIASAWVLLFSNDGKLRFYTFLGFVIGAILYNRILSSFVIAGIVRVLRVIKRIFLKVLGVVLYPLKIIKKFLLSIWKPIKKKIHPIYFRVKRFCLLPKIFYREIVKYTKFIKNKK